MSLPAGPTRVPHPTPAIPRNLSIVVLAVACIVIAVSALTYHSWHLFTEKHRPLVRGIDNNYYFFWLPSVVIDHDLDFTNQLKGSPSLSEEDRRLELAEPLTSSGLRYNKFPVGWSLASAPWFLGAHLLNLACGWPTTGWEPSYQIAVWLGQLLYAALGLLFSWKVLCHFFPPLPSLQAVLVGWLASPLVFYQTAGLSMTHSLVFSMVAISFWLGLKIVSEPRRRWFLLLGGTTGLLAVTRYTTVVYLLFPWLCALPALRQKKFAPKLTCAALGALPPIFLQLLGWRIIYGSWFVYSYGEESFHFAHPHLSDVLFSPFHGFFYWHPLMAIGIAGLVVWTLREGRPWPWVIAFFAVLAINASWWCWWFGSSFGNRSFEGCVFFAMAGLAWLLVQCADAPVLRRILFAACSALISWNVVLLALFLTKHIPSDAPVTWTDAVHAVRLWLLG